MTFKEFTENALDEIWEQHKKNKDWRKKHIPKILKWILIIIGLFYLTAFILTLISYI